MKVTKAAEARASGGTEQAMELINGYAKRELAPEEVFIFDLKLCDNQVDRDNERFSRAALEELAGLFVGKTGIFDHNWSAAGQKARIFSTQVVEDDTQSTAAGEPYAYLKASAYMLREGNEALIAEIEGGIKREVSVGCSMGKAVCSICGEERGSVKCGHMPGSIYGGRSCYFTLEEPKDAYEWSFVAVPAQTQAGVIKKFTRERKAATLEELAEEFADSGALKQLRALKEAAAVGNDHMAALREQVVKLSAMAGSGIDGEILRSAAGRMSYEELMGFRKAFEKKVDEMLPSATQLKSVRREEKISEEEFKV